RKIIRTIIAVTTVMGAGLRQDKARFIRYQSWNTTLYPVWTGAVRGGVKFEVSSDEPALTGARITFGIDILFPANQVQLPDGQVVWVKNCIVNGAQHRVGEPIYPQDNSVDKQNVVFPDGSPLCKNGDKKPPFVFVWETCGKYWQVSDGPSSSLTINTEDIPLGSYLMEVVIYHYRNKDKFIPIGYASTQFCITDQIPFAVTLTQVCDKDGGDHKFIQNQPVAFSVNLHDPSGYLGNSDITFNWDFGDGSGTTITWELTSIHTYTASGSFEPRVVVQAAIPDPACDTPPNSPSNTGLTAEAAPSKMPIWPGQINSKSRSQAVNIVIFMFHLCCSVMPLFCSTTHLTAVIDRQAPDTEEDCVIYRYGSFATELEVVEGIKSVEIIQAAGVFLMEEPDQNAVEFIVTCRGSLLTEVCTVVADADCLFPVKTTCSAMSPSTDCRLVLRHFFNDSVFFCLNVSMTNDVSLAVSSARVNIIISELEYQKTEHFINNFNFNFFLSFQ
uniref:PKD domain-containing protein n=1 Tax=Electrophorus electricus TaxID=8005 RepID=A0A4W4GUM1_ELEEL